MFVYGKEKNKYKNNFQVKYFIHSTTNVIREFKLKGFCDSIYVLYKKNGNIRFGTTDKLAAFDDLTQHNDDILIEMTTTEFSLLPG